MLWNRRSRWLEYALEELKRDVVSGELEEGTVISQKRSPIVKGLLALSGTLALALAGVLVYVFQPASDRVPRFTNPSQITSAVGVEDYPAWSPDGGRVAFQSGEIGDRDLWVVQLGGGAPVSLSAERGRDDYYPSWSPNGSQIAFVSDREIFVMSSVGGEPRKVLSVENAGSVRSAPQWSEDSAEIAVAFSGGSVEVVSLRNLERRQVPLSRRCFEMTWSPDGRYFACVDAPHREWDVAQLWIQPSEGGEPIAVTDGRTKDFNPVWSRNGMYLYFVSNRGGSMDLWRQRISENGRAEGEALPLTAGVGIRTATFSPDGTKIAYSKGRSVANVWRVLIPEDRPATWKNSAKSLSIKRSSSTWTSPPMAGTSW